MSKKVASSFEDDDDHRARRHAAVRASFIVRGWQRNWVDLVLECEQVQRALVFAFEGNASTPACRVGEEVALLKELELCLFDELDVTIGMYKYRSELQERELAWLKERTAHIT